MPGVRAGVVWVDVEGNLAPLKRQIAGAMSQANLKTFGQRGGAALASGLAQAGGKFETFGNQMKRVGSGAFTTGREISRAITAPVALAAGASIKFAIDFEKSMELLHTQAGASQAEVERLKGSVLALAKAGEHGPTELANALFHLESVGLRGSKAMEALKVAEEGATVGGADLESVTNALAGATQSGAKGTENLHGTMATLNAIIGQGNLRMDQLVGALGTGILSAARLAGVSLTDVGAAMATLTAQGQPADASATRLRMNLAQFTPSSSKAVKALKSIGLGQLDLARTLRSKGLVPALQELKDHLDSFSRDKDKQKLVLQAIFGGGRSSAAIVTLVQSLDDLRKRQEAIRKNTGSFAEAIAKSHETAAFKVHHAWASIQADLTQIGGQLAPVFADLVGNLSGVVTAFGKLPKGVKTGIIAFAGLTAVLGPVLLVFGAMTRAIGTLVGAFGFLLKRLGILGGAEATAAAEVEAANAGMTASFAALTAEVAALRVEIASLGPAAVASAAEMRALSAGGVVLPGKGKVAAPTTVAKGAGAAETTAAGAAGGAAVAKAGKGAGLKTLAGRLVLPLTIAWTVNSLTKPLQDKVAEAVKNATGSGFLGSLFNRGLIDAISKVKLPKLPASFKKGLLDLFHIPTPKLPKLPGVLGPKLGDLFGGGKSIGDRLKPIFEGQAKAIRETAASLTGLQQATQRQKATDAGVEDAQKHVNELRKKGKTGTYEYAVAVRQLDAAQAVQLRNQARSATEAAKARQGVQKDLDASKRALATAKEHGASEDRLTALIHRVAQAHTREAAALVNVERAQKGLNPVTSQAALKMGLLLKNIQPVRDQFPKTAKGAEQFARAMQRASAFRNFVIKAPVGDVQKAVGLVTKLQGLGKAGAALRIIANTKSPEDALKRLEALLHKAERERRIKFKADTVEANRRVEHLKALLDKLPKEKVTRITTRWGFHATVDTATIAISLQRKIAKAMQSAGLGPGAKQVRLGILNRAKGGPTRGMALVGEEGTEIATFPSRHSHHPQRPRQSESSRRRRPWGFRGLRRAGLSEGLAATENGLRSSASRTSSSSFSRLQRRRSCESWMSKRLTLGTPRFRTFGASATGQCKGSSRAPFVRTGRMTGRACANQPTRRRAGHMPRLCARRSVSMSPSGAIASFRRRSRSWIGRIPLCATERGCASVECLRRVVRMECEGVTLCFVAPTRPTVCGRSSKGPIAEQIGRRLFALLTGSLRSSGGRGSYKSRIGSSPSMPRAQP